MKLRLRTIRDIVVPSPEGSRRFDRGTIFTTGLTECSVREGGFAVWTGSDYSYLFLDEDIEVYEPVLYPYRDHLVGIDD